MGHNCRIGSGHTVYPARSIESDVVMFAKEERTIISNNVSYNQSDHHGYPDQEHLAQYHYDFFEEQDTESTEELIEEVSEN